MKTRSRTSGTSRIDQPAIRLGRILKIKRWKP